MHKVRPETLLMRLFVHLLGHLATFITSMIFPENVVGSRLVTDDILSSESALP